ncbi:glutaredoxin family protein [Serinibacter arcticus]|uniref:Glutaredoxin-like protein GlrX n=1 Tax=Serinibacter arcticus TaxID=1655435 RepID=A0A4Z1DZW9_9MICO|nr:glutaredoxin domain-containing protein [Serinibacter arcticus]TGO05174.1 Glutaredoxin-like protein GlrX [Serinibacter arcticus]
MSSDSSSTSSTPVTVYGADWCGDCRRTKAQLDQLAVPYTYVDLVAQPEAATEAHRISGRTNIPVVVYPDGSHQVEPSNLEVAAKLHLFGLA